MKGYKRSQKYIPGQSFKKKFKKHNPKNCTLEKKYLPPVHKDSL